MFFIYLFSKKQPSALVLIFYGTSNLVLKLGLWIYKASSFGYFHKEFIINLV
jgi:hypothetical protein